MDIIFSLIPRTHFQFIMDTLSVCPTISLSHSLTHPEILDVSEDIHSLCQLLDFSVTVNGSLLYQ